MIKNNFITTKGDEFIVSLAAHHMKQDVKNAGAYVYRFWSGVEFRLVSTCYQFNAVTILHLPGEKERGMLKIYKKYIVRGKLPSNEAMWSLCGLKHRTLSRLIRMYIKKILRKG